MFILIIYLSKKKVRFQKILETVLDLAFFGFDEEAKNVGYRNMEIMKVDDRIFTTIKERIEKMFGIRHTATLSTKGLGRR